MTKESQAVTLCSNILIDIKNTMISFYERSEVVNHSNIREIAELFSLLDFKSIFFELSKNGDFTLIDVVMPDEFHHRTLDIDASSIIRFCPNSNFFWIDEFFIDGKKIKISLSNNKTTLMVVASCNN